MKNVADFNVLDFASSLDRPGEENLARAVVLYGLHDLVSFYLENKASGDFWQTGEAFYQRTANVWFHSDENKEGSFVWWCEAANFDPPRIRTFIKNIPKDKESLTTLYSQLMSLLRCNN